MARYIEFQGKDIVTGEWVTGNLLFANSKYGHHELQYHDSAYIEKKGLDGRITKHPVIPQTIGQYTNVIGCNKEKIYDHDIVSNGQITGEVYWNYNYTGWRIAAENIDNSLYDTKLNNTFKVIGHKYDQLIHNN